MRLGDRRNLCNALLEVRGWLQEHFNNRNPIEGLRLEVFDVVDGGGKISFGDGNDPVAHILGNETVKGPDNADHRNVNVGENVGWSADD